MTSPPEGAEGCGRLQAEAARLSAVAPGYLDRVRDAARRLGIRDGEQTDAGAALRAVEELVVIDLDVPTESRLPVGRVAKVAIKRAIAWYLRYFGRQVSDLGQAVVHFAGIILGRTERLEQSTAALHSELERLTARLDRLEQGDRGGGATAPPTSPDAGQP